MNGSLRLRHRTVAICFVLVIALCGLVIAPVSAAGEAKKPGKAYLALGDSLAYGYQGAKFAVQYPNVDESTFDTGYADVFAAQLGHKRRASTSRTTAVRVRHRIRSSVAGAGPTGFTYVPNPGFCGDQPAAGVGAIFSKAWLHDAYPAASSLLRSRSWSRTITRIRSRSTSARTTRSCSSSSAGLVRCPAALTQYTIGALYTHIAANVAVIVQSLRAAAPHAEIIVLGLYNPYPHGAPRRRHADESTEYGRCSRSSPASGPASRTRYRSSTRRASTGAAK